jgi:two-component system chemotaxis sensor kinase CheA
LWGSIAAREPWASLADLDAYRCALEFSLLTSAPREELVEHYRYVPDQVRLTAIDSPLLVEGRGEHDGDALDPDGATVAAIYAAQRRILLLDDEPAWRVGRLKAVGGVLVSCCQAAGKPILQREVEAALARSLAAESGSPLLAWLDARGTVTTSPAEAGGGVPADTDAAPPPTLATEAIRFRATDSQPPARSLKVDQEKIDRLMDLIGEIVVFKNSLPYLAQRAENHFGVRDLAREITTQYGVINRIAEELQGAIMQVRMMPVSCIFQRFPRLVRDTSRNLGKDVQLVLVGEETEADKNIIESLADPLIHIVRNSLDHGLEGPEVRRAGGKAAKGTLTIRASQEADRVLIQIDDDGKGIDPAMIKRKAYEKGVIDEAALERITDQEAVNLVFTAGFSTVDVASDLSGRGVGMDVVRTAVEKVNGSITLASEVGKGTSIRISLPLSMAVTKVMIVETDAQAFGVPMDHVLETVRVPRAAIQSIKQSQTTGLRGRTVPLKALNALLGVAAEPKANADDELAVLVARVGNEVVGLIVDDFRETVDVIQKPLCGALAGLAAYSGSALMGDGSVLMVLNVKEIV